jgi:hypothetical protein
LNNKHDHNPCVQFFYCCIVHFQQSIRDYCWRDVELLAEGCKQFIRINKQETMLDENDIGLDPFQTNFTLPSYCNTIFRRNYMLKNSIGLIPANGYNPKINTSKKAETWLRFLANENVDSSIQYSSNGGEKKIGRF